MARRHGAKQSKSRSQPRGVNRKDATIKRWNRPEDIPMDEEDEFHAARDEILLDGEDRMSDDEGDEEEVFALRGMPQDSDSEEDDHDEDDEDDFEDTHPEPGPSTVKQKKGKKTSKAAASSESESESESEEEGWGKSKAAYYSSNAGQLDSDDEEANEMEEQEARRLQAKARDAMTDNDFGLEDTVEGAPEAEDELVEPAAPVIQKLPEDKGARLRHLEKASPEALALAGDWDDAARTLIKTQAKIAVLEDEDLLDKVGAGMLHLYYQALLQYATTLAFYLYLRASEKYAQRPDLLRGHPIMKRLLTFKQSISTLEDLGVNDDEEDDEDDEDSEDDELGLAGRIRGISAEELQSLLADMEAVTSAGRTRKNAVPSPEKPKPKAKAAPEEPPKKKRKTASASAPASLPVFDLEEPEFPAAPRASSRARAAADADAYGEPVALQAADAADKAARKKSLRFHTSKIESAAGRRERARAAAGGDDDIPWQQRKKERERQNKKELEKTRGMGGADLDDEEPEPRADPGRKRRRDEESASEDDGAEGYYDLVKRKTKEKKDKKKAEYEAAVALAKEGLITDDTAEGPRGVSRAILKNKGLTPHRSKSVRNPRVKKRQRYEKAKKKVASQKAVYKGGLAATGRYDGEKTGITKVIKSVKL
ncbi:Sas10 C-terminal domain-containing protein [Phanerochaete sordida]|uniref:Sas10 C-terminal domain-containing protein n=1 Tax=Phanerochaete sordida TaxID=48140 RepID=A0A9P3G530_9APHY|nr:Sas10 C-terminal domain-containing protein [Phanerochaete sordida]